MNSGLIISLFTSPANGWLSIRNANLSVSEVYFRYIIPLASMTPVCGFIGATQVGWPVAGEDVHLLLQRIGTSEYIGEYPRLSTGKWVIQLETENWRSNGLTLIPGSNLIKLGVS